VYDLLAGSLQLHTISAIQNSKYPENIAVITLTPSYAHDLCMSINIHSLLKPQ
jgi:hypothetical protein